MRRVVLFGAAMMAIGLALASMGGLAGLYIGFGLLAGVLGGACVGSPLLTYVSLWFVRRRGSAVALIASGQAVAGAVFPPLLQWGVDALGWRITMQVFAVFIFISVVTLTLIFLRPPPIEATTAAATGGLKAGGTTLGLAPNTLMILLMVAVFCCCVPMAMPMTWPAIRIGRMRVWMKWIAISWFHTTGSRLPGCAAGHDGINMPIPLWRR